MDATIVTFGEAPGYGATITAALAQLGANATVIPLPTAPSADALDWDAILRDAGWLHISGAAPAFSAQTAAATLAAVHAASAEELTISCELTIRPEWWHWRPCLAPRELAEETLRTLLPFVDVVIATPEEAEQALGLTMQPACEHVAIEAYCHLAERIVEQFPNVCQVAMPLWECLSATHAHGGGLLYDADDVFVHLAPTDDAHEFAPCEIPVTEDGVGNQAVFIAGLLYALTTRELRAPFAAIRFAVAAVCRQSACPGVFATRDTVASLMADKD